MRVAGNPRPRPRFRLKPIAPPRVPDMS